MSDVYRFGVSLEKPLIEDFDLHIKAQQYKSRSEAIRDLIREELLRKKMDRRWSCCGSNHHDLRSS
jgi:CopG family nickel-responsive transcriptional regulator